MAGHISRYFIVIFLFFTAFAQTASGHVKWFSPYDTSEKPLSLHEVTSIPYFWYVFALSFAFIFFMVYVDAQTKTVNRYINVWRYQWLKKLPDDFAYRVFTLTLIIFFTSIWAIGGITLTPELKHSSYLVATIQVLIIVSLMTRATAKYAGLGIFALWVYAITNYGVFHLADYIIFLGIAVFMLIGHKPSQFKTSALAFSILYFSVSWTLQWASVEKWIYPTWSYPLLESRPYLSMGFPKEIFMVMAGFVEFTLAFLMITLVGTGFLVTPIVLAIVFLLAIIDFGKVDAIGHLGIIVCLFLMSIMGPSKVNIFLSNFDQRPFMRAAKLSGLYLLCLVFFTAIYYGIQKIAA